MHQQRKLDNLKQKQTLARTIISQSDSQNYNKKGQHTVMIILVLPLVAFQQTVKLSEE